MSAWSSATSWSASPSTVTTEGAAVTLAISNPAAGVPVTIGVTGTDRLSRSVKTGIVTRAVAGETSIGRTAFPSASTAMSGTSWSKSRPPGSMTTSARTDATWAIADSGPDTVTVVGLDRGLAELQRPRPAVRGRP